PRRLSPTRRSKEGYETWLKIRLPARRRLFAAAEKERILSRDRFISSPRSTTPSSPSPICRATRFRGRPQEDSDSEAPRSLLRSLLRPQPKQLQELLRSTDSRSLRYM